MRDIDQIGICTFRLKKMKSVSFHNFEVKEESKLLLIRFFWK